MQKVNNFKCPHCGAKYKSLQVWGNHVQRSHPGLIPKDWSYGRYFYYIQSGKKAGSCVVCKNPTEWNETTLKYSRFCSNPNCKEQYREMFKNRMIGKYGKVHLLDDPEQQRKMLANKHISGQYTFRDGTKVTYTGTYELDFLRFLDRFLYFNGSDIMMPSPHTYYYEYHNENDKEHEGRHFYVPDAYIPSLNLEIEIKQNTNMHPKLLMIDKVKEEQKDAMMKSRTDVNYFKIVEKDYSSFINYLSEQEFTLPAQEAFNDDPFWEELPRFTKAISENFNGYDFDAESQALEAAGYSKVNKNPVFIILTSGNTALANIIKKATGDEFSHSSISFNSRLDPLYSFGTKKITTKGGELGFIKTNPHSDLWYTDRGDVPYSIYVTFVSEENIAKMKRRLEYFVNNANDMKYSFAGLLRVFFNMKSPKKKHWFCSAFVAEILNAGKPLEKDSTLYRPQSLTNISDVEYLYSGTNISYYDHRKTEKLLKEMMTEDPAMEVTLVKYKNTYVTDMNHYMDLSKFKFATINPILMNAYKKQAPGLSKIRYSKDSFGELIVDGANLVGYYNTEKKDNVVWLQALEICKNYRGNGLSPQLLMRAINKGKVSNVAINAKNELAIKVYMDFGFIEYARDEDILYLHYTEK